MRFLGSVPSYGFSVVFFRQHSTSPTPMAGECRGRRAAGDAVCAQPAVTLERPGFESRIRRAPKASAASRRFLAGICLQRSPNLSPSELPLGEFLIGEPRVVHRVGRLDSGGGTWSGTASFSTEILQILAQTPVQHLTSERGRFHKIRGPRRETSSIGGSEQGSSH